jgi:hypothetical protein
MLKGGNAVLRELTYIPTEILMSMLFAVVADEVQLTASDAAEIEQIQGELQRRGEEPHWSFRTVN